MNNYPLVSIIMPTYNSEKFIKESINSVINQSYQNIEILILDDDSNDLTELTINKYKDKRIKLFKNNEQLGISKSLNRLIHLCKGEYICRMDSDDIMHKDKIKLQINYMLINELHFCGTWIKFFGNQDKIIKYPIMNNDIRFFMLFGCPFAHPSIIAKKKLFKDNMYTQTVAEDYHLWTRLALSSKNLKFGNVPKILLKYRRHKEQLSADNSDIIKDSISISRNYSSKYINDEKILKELSFNNFGMNKEYEFSNYYKLIVSMIVLAKNKKASLRMALNLIRSILFKVKKVNFTNLIQIFKLLYKEKISFLDVNILIIIFIFFLRKVGK